MIREEYRETGELEAAIENSIRKCRDEGVLAFSERTWRRGNEFLV